MNDVHDAAQTLGSRAGGSRRDEDPYGTAIGRITEALRKAYAPVRNARMSEGEYQILRALGERLIELDPHVNLTVPKEDS